MPTQDPPKKIGQVPDTARPKGYSAVTGPVQQDVYPKAVSSPYRLPWPGGVAWQCIQGNRGIVSHKGPTRFSYDFGMPVGSHVCAARAGTVVTVIDSHTGRGFSAPNNKVGIRHEDGTIGWYLHLEQGGSLVRVGEAVERGQEIARSGNVGLSLVPHLHFHVSRGKRATIPVTFKDASVRVDEGIPRMFRRYVSENAPPKR
jgi:murein DD-endopeptidase MepM/ murein hydrolase activator NlpD